jgi:hypothetical protein
MLGSPGHNALCERRSNPRQTLNFGRGGGIDIDEWRRLGGLLGRRGRLGSPAGPLGFATTAWPGSSGGVNGRQLAGERLAAQGGPSAVRLPPHARGGLGRVGSGAVEALHANGLNGGAGERNHSKECEGLFLGGGCHAPR